MEVIIGKTSGFCAGVQNAIIKTEKELEKTHIGVNCLGELVHNKQVIEKLEEKGLKIIDDIERADRKTIIRAHGISKEIYQKANELGIELIDLTCPKVLQVHKLAEQYAKSGYFIILVGIENHPETIGTISFCGEKSYLIKDKQDIPEAISKFKNSNTNKIFIISQTTYSLSKFEEIVEQIKELVQGIEKIEINNTICAATRLRQEETEKLSKKVEYMIIVGGKNSSNTKKLYDIAKANCKKTVLCETLEDLNVKEIKKYNKIGIMAGASTPNESVEEIKRAILSKQ